MSNVDERSATDRKPLPPAFVHELRNSLGVAVGIADLLSLTALTVDQAGDLAKIRDACLRAVETLNRWDRAPARRVGMLLLSLAGAAERP